MYGLFQTTFYFGYMALFSVGLGIMCGKLADFAYLFLEGQCSSHTHVNENRANYSVSHCKLFICSDKLWTFAISWGDIKWEEGSSDPRTYLEK